MAVRSKVLQAEPSGLIKTCVINRGHQEAASEALLPAYDPSCYLCPGNKRAQGDMNPHYENTFAFVNDYSAVKEQQADYQSSGRDGSVWRNLSSSS